MSTKAPAFQFYPLDFLQGSKLMTLAERGAYITLLCEQWDTESLSARTSDLAKILGVSRRETERIWSIVGTKFYEDTSGRWRNRRLEDERTKQLARRLALAQNGALGGRPRKASGKLDESNSFQIAKARENQNKSLSSSSLALQDQNTERSDLPPAKAKALAHPRTITAELRGRFDAFWAEYPNKKARGAAWKAWQRLKPSPELTSEILSAIRSQRGSRQWLEGFIPHPATWLNQERWSDQADGSVAITAAPDVPFWDECALCGDIHPRGQACSPGAIQAMKGGGE